MGYAAVGSILRMVMKKDLFSDFFINVKFLIAIIRI
jgi:hypothetical protein